MKQSKLRTLVFSAAVAALVAVATLFLHVPIPMEAGYCNLGDGVILASGALLGPWAAAAAALGSALADLLLGYMAYAPVTAVRKGAMGLMAGLCAPQKARKPLMAGAAAVFLAAYVPLMAKFFRVAGKTLRGE